MDQIRDCVIIQRVSVILISQRARSVINHCLGIEMGLKHGPDSAVSDCVRKSFVFGDY
jgi:hypothetical protein